MFSDIFSGKDSNVFAQTCHSQLQKSFISRSSQKFLQRYILDSALFYTIIMPQKTLYMVSRDVSYLFAPVSPINMTAMKRYHTQFFPTPGPLKETFLSGYSIAHLPPIITYLLLLPRNNDKNLLKSTFSKSLTRNQAKEPYNQGIKAQVTAIDIKKEDSFRMKSLTSEAYMHKVIFKFNPLFLVLTRQG